jgi:hypothetical protein
MSLYRILSNSSFISDCDTPLYVVSSCWQSISHNTHKECSVPQFIILFQTWTPNSATYNQLLWCSVTWALCDVASKCVGVGVVSLWEGTPNSFLVESLYYSFKLVRRHVFQRTGLFCSVQNKSPSPLHRVVSSKTRNYWHWRDRTHYCTWGLLSGRHVIQTEPESSGGFIYMEAFVQSLVSFLIIGAKYLRNVSFWPPSVFLIYLSFIMLQKDRLKVKIKSLSDVHVYV